MGMSVGHECVCTRSMHVTGRGRYDARTTNFTQHLKSARVRIHLGTHFASYGGHVSEGLKGVFFTFNHSFYSSTSITPSVRADSSS